MFIFHILYHPCLWLAWNSFGRFTEIHLPLLLEYWVLLEYMCYYAWSSSLFTEDLKLTCRSEPIICLFSFQMVGGKFSEIVWKVLTSGVDGVISRTQVYVRNKINFLEVDVLYVCTWHCGLGVVFWIWLVFPAINVPRRNEIFQ